MITVIVINKLNKKEQLNSHCLIFRNVSFQIIFDNFIQDFILIINLKMISNKKSLFNYLNLTDFLSKMRNNSRIFICNNVFQKVKMTFNMLKKQLCEICSCNIILNRYKQNVFNNMIYYD